jgi:hypothetical protein
MVIDWVVAPIYWLLGVIEPAWRTAGVKLFNEAPELEPFTVPLEPLWVTEMPERVAVEGGLLKLEIVIVIFVTVVLTVLMVTVR